jgi:hypothetical protein
MSCAPCCSRLSFQPITGLRAFTLPPTSSTSYQQRRSQPTHPLCSFRHHSLLRPPLGLRVSRLPEHLCHYSTLPLFCCRYFRDCSHAICGPGAPAHATRGTGVLARAMRNLEFTFHATPLVYQRRHPTPASEPSHTVRQSTTPSSWLVTPASPTRWSPVVLRGHKTHGSSIALR